ncbi:hypothetical protein DXP75_06855 [Listeria monocytogenes]|nr:hypothetical protein [Listeria monocytogenes]
MDNKEPCEINEDSIEVIETTYYKVIIKGIHKSLVDGSFTLPGTRVKIDDREYIIAPLLGGVARDYVGVFDYQTRRHIVIYESMNIRDIAENCRTDAQKKLAFEEKIIPFIKPYIKTRSC